MKESPNNKRTERVLFMVVLLAGLVGTLLGMPWSIVILGDASAVRVSAAAEFLLLLVPASAVGVWLGKRVCLGSRARELVSGSLGRSAFTRMGLLPAVLVGLALGGAGFVAQNSLPEGALTSGLGTPSTSAWLLRCLSAALTEEIFFRFGLLTLFVWLVVLIAKKPASWVPVLWVGNLLSAVAFACAHLPQLTPGGSSFIVPVAAFSTVAGMAMGWLYIRQGLIAAVVGHFIADVMVYVVPRLAAGYA
ncbi:MAG: CPBP family intramembrane metalloprotease [Gemmatimonadales bacterium]|nr:CPBP family intramembrane metalloprotease [Gemmatimonadales bacterium]NIN12583.1 CPBP family intramembrane metalloprotease [Gemmatimonadales bacterium]NIR03578.1 CPBP family intramembrane metalloprotease [Gemmatimonadales bacterium]NIS65900.1 CPBP family intramembrane metalloprotease [Gemmatimonadales bacterium]